MQICDSIIIKESMFASCIIYPYEMGSLQGQCALLLITLNVF